MPFKTNALTRGYWCILLTFLSTGVFAQKTVTGKILSNTDKQPVVGATIQVKGSGGATQTDVNGAFSLKVPGDRAVLVISAVGFEKLEMPVAGRTDFGVINLNTSTSSLNEIVVTGYSAQKKRDITARLKLSIHTQAISSGCTKCLRLPTAAF